MTAGPPFSASLPSIDSACHESLREVSAHWHHKLCGNAVGKLWSTLSWCLQGCRRTYTCSSRDPPLCCQLLPKSGTEFGERIRDPRTARESSRRNCERSPNGLSETGRASNGWMIDVRTVDGKYATAIVLGGTEGRLQVSGARKVTQIQRSRPCSERGTQRRHR